MNPGDGLQLDRQLSAALDTAAQRRLGRLETSREGLQENREGLEKAAKEFEGVFLNTLMKAMRKTVPENELFNSGGATKFYQQMHDAELAQALATGRSGLGVADLIVQQFADRVEASAVPDASETTSNAAASNAISVTTATELAERAGPPAPVPVDPDALQRYRSMSAVGESTAKLARLRLAATGQGTAVADTLGRYSGEIMNAADQTGVEPALLLAVVMEESGGDATATSHKGAEGLMQLMPATAEEVGVTDRTHPGQSVLGGARYLARMLDRYDGRLDLALAAYNAGPGNVDAAGGAVPEYQETRRYVERVSERYEALLTGTKMANE